MSSELKVGCTVEVFGLVSASQYNGSRGVLLQFDTEKRRWVVELQSAEILRMKATNLRFLEDLASAFKFSKMSISTTASDIKNKDRKSCVSKYNYLPLFKPTADQLATLEIPYLWKQYRLERASMDTKGGRICDVYDGDIRDIMKTDSAERIVKVDKADVNKAKATGAENQLTQHNWDNEGDEGTPASLEGGFNKAPTEELAKRKIVKARRSCKGTAGGSDGVTDAPATEKSASEAAPAFSWSSAAPESGDKAKSGDTVDAGEKSGKAVSKDKVNDDGECDKEEQDSDDEVNDDDNDDCYDDGDDDGDEDEDEEVDCNCNVKKMIFNGLRNILNYHKLDTEVTIALLQNVVVLKIDDEWEDFDCLRSLDIETAVWSPVGLPLGIILSMSFHERSRFYSREFSFHLECELVPRPQRGESRKIFLCSNELLDPPEVPGLDDLLDEGRDDVDVWEEVESPDASGINPDTALILRQWLFGDASESRRLLSDRALLAFLLSASGVYLAPVKTGYCWVGDADELRARGADPGTGRATRSWLDHAVATAAGAPDPVDRLYVPYDQREAKARWGRKVLALRERLLEQSGGGARPGPAAGRGKKAQRAVAPERVWDLAEAGRLPWDDIALP